MEKINRLELQKQILASKIVTLNQEIKNIDDKINELKINDQRQQSYEASKADSNSSSRFS